MGISLSIKDKDRKKISKGHESIGKSVGEISQLSNLKRFTFSELINATTNFPTDDVLGEGASGYVYKGWVNEHSFAPSNPETGIMIAVKRLTSEDNRSDITYSLKDDKEWLADIKFLGELHHPNLLELIGYCLEDNQRLLVYECMPNGSLDSHLFRETYMEPLSWHLRMKVALGAAKGLAYLHNYVRRPVRYRFFTTSSILLDSNFNAKLSYSRIATDRPGDDTHVVTRCRQRLRYVSPEYIMSGQLTHRGEVYSFGIVLLEILLGKNQCHRDRQREEKELLKWVKHYLTINSRLKGDPCTLSQELEVANLACECLCKEPFSRPSMDRVVNILGSIVAREPYIKSCTK